MFPGDSGSVLEIWIIVVIDVKVVHEWQRIRKGHDGRLSSVKDKGNTKGERSISQRKYKGSDDMAWMMKW